MSPKQEYKKKMKELAIIRAAEELFFTKAYSSITVDKIAKKAGVTKRTLYSYFPSKLALFIRVFEDYLRELHKQIINTAQQDIPADQKVIEIFRVMFLFSKENEAFMRLFWTLDTDEFDGELPPELSQSIHLWNKDMINVGVKVVEAAQKQNLIYSCDPRMLIHMMSACIKGIIIHSNKETKFKIANIKANDLYSFFMKIFVKGLFEASVPEREMLLADIKESTE